MIIRVYFFLKLSNAIKDTNLFTISNHWPYKKIISVLCVGEFVMRILQLKNNKQIENYNEWEQDDAAAMKDKVEDDCARLQSVYIHQVLGSFSPIGLFKLSARG